MLFGGAESCAGAGEQAAGAETALVVVNTCTVTSKAEQKSRRVIRALLEKHPRAAVVVTGCYAELEREKIAALSGRVAVLAGTQKNLLAELARRVQPLLAARDAGARQHAVQALIASLGTPRAGAHTAQDSFALSTDTFFAHSRSSLKIQDGCDNACSYCRVRLARGTSRSLSADEVIERVQLLERAGQSEVVLTGVNISLYKSERGGEEILFPALIGLILHNTRAIAVRVSSLYPQSVSAELCAILAHERVRPHFHLSVQSGSDAVLARMNRPYGSGHIARAVEALRNIKHNPFISCDIIAGFPRETDEDFAHTLTLCRECAFAWIHAFPFSPRPGTAAFDMDGAPPQTTVKERCAALAKIAAAQKEAYIASCAGKVFLAVIEQPMRAKKSDEGLRFLRAVTENFLHVTIALPQNAAPPAPGSQVAVRVIGGGARKASDACDARAELG